MPDRFEEWILEAEQYAEDVYQLTLEQLGFEEDCSVIMESPHYWVDQAFKGYEADYDPSPDDQESVTRIGGWG